MPAIPVLSVWQSSALWNGREWYCSVQSLYWMLGGASSLFPGCHSPVGGWGLLPIFWRRSPECGSNKALLPLGVCSVPEEVSAEASEARVVTAKPMHPPCRHLWFYPDAALCCVLFSTTFIPGLVLGWHWGPRPTPQALWHLSVLLGKSPLPGPILLRFIA